MTVMPFPAAEPVDSVAGIQRGRASPRILGTAQARAALCQEMGLVAAVGRHALAF